MKILSANAFRAGKGGPVMQARPSKRMATRAALAMAGLSLAFLYGIGALIYAGLINGEENRLKAERNQLSDTQIAA